MIVNLLRVSKKNYKSSIFQENQGNVKKHVMVYELWIDISKKQCVPPTKIVYNNEMKYSNTDIANSFNHFFYKYWVINRE